MSKKIALVHDQLTQYGGAERVLDVFHEMYSTAPIYTTIYLKDKLPEKYRSYNIKTTFLDKIPQIRNNQKLRAPIFPYSIETIRLKEYDIILSDTQGIAKGVRTNMNQYHVCYVHTIPWAVWNLKNEKGRYVTKYLGQHWDYKTAQNPDVLIANSKNTQFRIGKFYNREAQIIYPPVEVNKLQEDSKDIDNKEDFVIFIGRLEGYKGELELAKVCTELKQRLVIIGKGKNQQELKNYSKYIELKDNCTDEEKAKLLKQAKCLFNGSNEDFGINMAEALAVGTPVVALGKGGALEIVEDKKTGILFDTLSNADIHDAILEINNLSFDISYLQNSAQKFSKDSFINNISTIVNK